MELNEKYNTEFRIYNISNGPFVYEGIEKFDGTDELIDELESVKGHNYSMDNIKSYSIDGMKKNTKEFIDSKFKFHDIREMNTDIHFSYDYQVCMLSGFVDEAVEITQRFMKRKSPYDLKTEFVLDEEYYGGIVQEPSKLYNIQSLKEYLKIVGNSFSKIMLPNRINDLTLSCYMHELTHSQLISNRGSIIEYNNIELLPMFMEYLYSYYNDRNLFNYILNKRLNLIMESYNEMNTNLVYRAFHGKELLPACFEYNHFKYIVSTLRSFQLFDLYIMSDFSVKKEILSDIQKVFDGKSKLEEILSKYEIMKDSSFNTNYVKRIIKSC